MHILVMAKSPVPGKVKTRLCPPLTPHEAASVAEASLALTLESVAAAGPDRRYLALDGEPGGWLPPGFTVFEQQGATFADRLAHAWSFVGAPGLQIGMDTPQVSPQLLNESLGRITPGETAAVLGPATDGGWWAIGAGVAWRADIFSAVPMSTDRTCACQSAALERSGHAVTLLPELRDIDTFDDAVAVARDMPGSRLGVLLDALAEAALLSSDRDLAQL